MRTEQWLASSTVTRLLQRWSANAKDCECHEQGARTTPRDASMLSRSAPRPSCPDPIDARSRLPDFPRTK